MFHRQLLVGLCVVLSGILALNVPSCTDNPVPAGAFEAWPVNGAGFTVETLPMRFAASFVSGQDVFFGLPTGEIFRTNDRDIQGPWTSLGNPLNAPPRLVFASSGGAVFASAPLEPMYRTADNGQTWQKVLDVPVWRMEEDDQGNLYAGDYIKQEGYVATLYKSADGGATWTIVFRDPNNHHIHTVRWDNQYKRLYIAYGDRQSRGQAFSDDRGQTWVTIASGVDEGDTDVSLTNDYIIWLSDDASGRVFLANRGGGAVDGVLRGTQYMWFTVAQGDLIYIGTMASNHSRGKRAALLASSDQGQSWQKLIETPPSTQPYDQGLYGDSRHLSTNGWLYCTDPQQSYRIRWNRE